MTLTAPEPLLVLDEQVRSIPDALREVNRREGIVEALIVPWMTPADIVEPIPGQGIIEYREQFARGAFARAAKAPQRVALTYTHSHLMPDRMGHGVELRDSDEGAVMVWKLMRDSLERALELLETTHTGMSVTFRSLRPQFGSERPGELVTRELAHLISVAATDDPAYTDARVLALRARDAELEAQREAQATRRAQYVDSLLFLRARGRELTPAQVSYLAEHGHPAA